MEIHLANYRTEVYTEELPSGTVFLGFGYMLFVVFTLWVKLK